MIAVDRRQEIERKFLLDGLPPLPAGAVAHEIEQGYLPESEARGPEAPLEGRLRRTVEPDGSIVFTHTVKAGEGLVRREAQRTIGPQEFEQQWPRTIGRRLKKRRYVIAESGLVWEIDRFEELDLVLAEVELPTRDARAELPEWLAPHVVREVTDEPAYRNYELAMKSRSQESGVRSQESPES